MGERVFSVTEVNTYVARSLQADPMLREISVRGEVSNARRYASGHWYFTLKDEGSALRCVWFLGSQRGSTVRPEEGARVIARGSAGLYLRDGQYQMTVSALSADGTGSWFERFERMKALGIARGWFDEARKRPLPAQPRRIGIVTSADGAALRDIIRVARRRMPWVDLLLYPVLVQGSQAAEQIAEGIRVLGASGQCDVIITGRGGGSMEDLWAFNEQPVLEAIVACPVPVISAVGHQTDTLLSDYAADVRAATPSMAAELATVDRGAMKEQLDGCTRRMQAALAARMAAERRRLEEAQQRLDVQSPTARLKADRDRVAELQDRLERAMRRQMEARRDRLNANLSLLTALSPEKVTARGYALVRTADGHLLTDAASAAPGQKLTVKLARGSVAATVDEIMTEENP